MATELIGAKLLAPYFGTTIYVWASIFTVTLLGLATGYALGGYFSKKIKSVFILKKGFTFWRYFYSPNPFSRPVNYGFIIELTIYIGRDSILSFPTYPCFNLLWHGIAINYSAFE